MKTSAMIVTFVLPSGQRWRQLQVQCVNRGHNHRRDKNAAVLASQVFQQSRAAQSVVMGAGMQKIAMAVVVFGRV